MKVLNVRYILFLPLMQPQYRKLGTDWLNKSAFDNLLVSIETEIQDLEAVTESCHQVLKSADGTIFLMKKLFFCPYLQMLTQFQ